jgi:hypothetical protein
MTRTLTLWAVLAAAGCSGGGRVEDFTPSADKARKALEAALAHWQGGGKPGSVPGTAAPVVEVTDSKWAAGQKLKSFEVVGDEPPAGAGPRFFKVKLTPASGSPVEAKYAVLGIDPLLVYRDEDYQKLSGVGK